MSHAGTLVTGNEGIDIEKIANDIVEMFCHFGAEAELLGAQPIDQDDAMTRG